MQTVMNHNFSRIPAPEIQRSMFDRSCGHKTTFDSGLLIPMFCDEILPGDTVRMNATIFARIATLLSPIMDNIYLDTFWFFVPNRLLWENWEKFNGAQDNPGDSTDFLVPFIDDDNMVFDAGTIYDYFGLPTEVEWAGGTGPNALPFRAYNLIFNEWFRDQNLEVSRPVAQDDGPDLVTDYQLMRRAKRHDYFTSCLPWPQKGDSVSLPLGTSAPVIGNGETLGLVNATDWATDVQNRFGMKTQTGTVGVEFGQEGYNRPLGTAVAAVTPPVGTNWVAVTPDPAASGLIADLSGAVAATINQLRQSFQIQKILERDARGGTRYTELLRAHFGVISPDFRLQRPEYLGGSSQRLNVRQVPQTSESGAGTPQATLAAFGDAENFSGFNKSFVEHGYIIGIVNVRADIVYQQGLNRMWSRRTRYDFYLPALAHLGEQSVLNKEIFYPNLGTNADGVFGYQERWAEYRYKPSYVTGQFRSNHATSLDFWHLALDFAAMPALNSAFMFDNPPIDRVIAVPAEPHVIADMYFDFKHARPMPVYSVPGQIDRF